MIKSCVIGLSKIGQIHCSNLKKIKKTKLSYVYDVDPKLRKKISKKYNRLHASDFNTILKDKSIKLFIIASPTTTHEYYLTKLINHKKMIFRVLEILVNLRSKFFKQPYGDQGLIIHKTNYFKNNGFRKIPLMEDVDFLRRLKNKKDLKQLNLPIFISSRKWEKTNIFLQALKNWNLRRRWLKGESIKSIYSDYYKK